MGLVVYFCHATRMSAVTLPCGLAILIARAILAEGQGKLDPKPPAYVLRVRGRDGPDVPVETVEEKRDSNV